jgi:hypothetical protein
MNLFVMSLPVELVIQPLVVIVALLSAVAGHKTEHRPAKSSSTSFSGSSAFCSSPTLPGVYIGSGRLWTDVPWRSSSSCRSG